jgi:DNA-binding transcriptional ArsR family regulator
MDRRGPDYELADRLDVTTAEQHRALGNLTRSQILGLLNEEAATITQLAATLGVLKGSASYHVRLLERAGLVRVVRTRRVRGVVERYYGRTARRFELDAPGAGRDAGGLLLRTAAAELDRRGPVEPDDVDMVTSTHARLDPARAREFRTRLTELIEELRTAGSPGQPQYGLVVALYSTGLRPASAGSDTGLDAGPDTERDTEPVPGESR